ncbi:MAG: Poly(3-hydroxyalkanoate) depolymerase, partial [uncultured Microvirga sp.]
MRGLGNVTAKLGQYRKQWERTMASVAASGPSAVSPPGQDLREVEAFGANPGNLRMRVHVPDDLPPGAPLVVVLHGCSQTASGYNHGAGWSTLADRHGIAVLFPEQQRANNPNLCFNWFQPSDTERGRGEALSIQRMVERMILDHGIDRKRVFVTGLSAGGAMTSVMLATYPEVFAAGAVIAGLPYGSATTVQEAFDGMFKGTSRPAKEWGDLVRAASPHRGPWPKISVWHGDVDATVKNINADEIVKQWGDLHGLAASPSHRETVDGYPRAVWQNQEGEDVIESYTLTGMAHGTPLSIGDGEQGLGAAGPFLLDVGISSSHHIAKFWGLTGQRLEQAPARAAASVIRLPGPDSIRPSDEGVRSSNGGQGHDAVEPPGRRPPRRSPSIN